MTLTFPLRRKTMGSEGPRQPCHMSRRLDWLRRWMPSWRIRPRTSAYKLTFDLHRAAGLWVWPIILTIAFTSFSLNLSREVFFPALSLVSKVTPGPFETRPRSAPNQPIDPELGFGPILHLARERASQEQGESQPGRIFLPRNLGVSPLAVWCVG